MLRVPYLAGFVLCFLSLPVGAAESSLGLPALTITEQDGEQRFSVSLQILALMTGLTLLPSFVIMLTSFTRIVVVFAILRQAIGMQQTPSNQILVGLALFLSIFVMMPVLQQVHEQALDPYVEEQIGPQEAVSNAGQIFKQFMLNQTREADLGLFVELSERRAGPSAASPQPPVALTDEVPAPAVPAAQALEDIDFFVIVPAFMTSELKTAFQIGFMLFIPFLIIDMVVASILMSMGMMMLSPLIISLPFKIMLFVLIDGWVLIMGALAQSFGMP